MPQSVTFAVDTVKPAVLPLEELGLEEALKGRLDAKVLGASHGAARFVRPLDTHPLIAAVHLAFSGHRPLVLSPDILWITIAQGFALHVIRNAEALRFDLVSHRGRMRLSVKRDPSQAGFESGDFWPGVVDAFSAMIQGHSPAMHDLMVCDFSTTGPVERVVSQVVLMEAMREYFDFVVECICGIPTITLEGTPDDWRKLRDKVTQLPRYGLEDWAKHLLPLCDQFIRASEGNADPAFWRAIYKLRDAYGGDTFNGWIGKLFPFIRNPLTGAYDFPNPMLVPDALSPEAAMDEAVSLSSDRMPTGLSRVPVTLEVLTDTGPVKARMALTAGFVGTSQNADTLALRPVPGWVFHEDLGLDAMLRRLEDEHAIAPPMSEERYDSWRWTWGEACGLHADIQRLYSTCDGASLFGEGPSAVYRIRPAEGLEFRAGARWWNASRPGPGGPSTPSGWTRFCDVGANGFLVFCFQRQQGEALPIYWVKDAQDAQAVCVAESLGAFLRQALNSEGRVYFLAPDFSPGARVELSR